MAKVTILVPDEISAEQTRKEIAERGFTPDDIDIEIDAKRYELEMNKRKIELQLAESFESCRDFVAEMKDLSGWAEQQRRNAKTLEKKGREYRNRFHNRNLRNTLKRK